MNPLTSIKVKRGQVLREWTASEEQLTDAGRADFWARQQERMKRAQADRDEATVKVRDLRKAKS